MRFILSVPPSINQLYKSGYNKRTGKQMWYKSEIGNAWQEEALWELKRQAKGHSVNNNFDTVYITYCYNDRRRRDIDNGIKLTLDILVKAGLLKDDSQITFLQVQKTIGKKSYCMIELL